MRVSIYLKPNKSIADGKTFSFLCFRVRDKSVDIKVPTDIMVNTKAWDADKQRYKKTKIVAYDEQERINSLVDEILTQVNNGYDPNKADSSWLKGVIFGCEYPSEENKSADTTPTLFDHFDSFLKLHPMSKGYIICVKGMIAHLKRYQMFQREIREKKDFTLYVETLTSDTLVDFREFLQNEHTYYNRYPEFFSQFKMKNCKQLSNTTVVNTMNYLRTFLRWCIKQGITDNDCYKMLSFPNAVYGDAFFLNIEERNKVYSADLSGREDLQTIRDVFMFHSLVGCRAGDLFNLTRENIVDDMLVYIPHKTKDRKTEALRVPLNNKAKEMLSRFPKTLPKLVPHIYINTYNVGIRELLKYVGINRMVSVYDTTERKDVQKPLCDVASSHTARKTFIGILYNRGAEPALIRSMTGHSERSNSFDRYHKMDEELRNRMIENIK